MFRTRIIIIFRLKYFPVNYVFILALLIGGDDVELAAVTCGQGNECRTRDVASQAERGGRECQGKKYSIGGKVRSSQSPLPASCNLYVSVGQAVVPGTASGPPGPGLAVTRPAEGD